MFNHSPEQLFTEICKQAFVDFETRNSLNPTLRTMKFKSCETLADFTQLITIFTAKKDQVLNTAHTKSDIRGALMRLDREFALRHKVQTFRQAREQMQMCKEDKVNRLQKTKTEAEQDRKLQDGEGQIEEEKIKIQESKLTPVNSSTQSKKRRHRPAKQSALFIGSTEPENKEKKPSADFKNLRSQSLFQSQANQNPPSCSIEYMNSKPSNNNARQGFFDFVTLINKAMDRLFSENPEIIAIKNLYTSKFSKELDDISNSLNQFSDDKLTVGKTNFSNTKLDCLIEFKKELQNTTTKTISSNHKKLLKTMISLIDNQIKKTAVDVCMDVKRMHLEVNTLCPGVEVIYFPGKRG